MGNASFGQMDLFLYAVLPYAALIVFLLMTIQRYRQQSFSYSSLSSQFLENRQHFWGMVPFHYGILIVLFGHVVAFLLPRSILLWNAQPLRLYVLEIAALAFGILTLVGLVQILLRRAGNNRLREVTTVGDWIVYGLLLVQVATGVGVACFHGWGSSWFAATLAPYLWSLVKLNPDLTYVTPMPWLFKAHLIGAWVLIGFFPFTRLVHILVIPNMYLWRRTQVVRWNYDRRAIRRTAAPRTEVEA